MKQRVIIVTKFYYRRGGDCIYAMNLERLLREQGHEVAIFAMQYPENEQSEWQSYWPSEVNFSGGGAAKIAAVKRTLGYGDVASAFKKLMDDFRPDVVHLNNIHSYLSPVVARMAHRRGAKVVWTLHDYKLICPSYSCIRDGNVCELCFDNKCNVLVTRCMKGSLAASAVAYMEALRWNRGELQRNTDVFICPSEFMASKMRQGHFDSKKLVTLCNFIAPEMLEAYKGVDASIAPDDYYCYVGRLSEEKGVRTLLKAASALPYRLKVAGDGPLAAELKEQYASYGNIEFLGRVGADEVKDLLSRARFSVMPSECYENNPLGIIESLCAGAPVVGADIGGIPELVKSGATFESGNVKALMNTVSKLWEECRSVDRKSLQQQSLKAFSPEVYYARLMEIYG